MKRILWAALAALTLAACARTSATTLLSGTFGDNAPESVTVKAGDFEKTVPVQNGSFQIEIPTDVKTIGTIDTDHARSAFIPDGTPLSIDFSQAEPIVVSAKPKISVQERFNAFYARVDELVRAQMSMSEEELDREVIELGMKTIRENGDNALGLQALSEFYYLFPLETLSEAMDCLSDDLKEDGTAQSIAKSLDAKRLTQVGRKFSDFTIVQDEADPAGSTVHFSDFIGQGKYILVDFWASWCGPCRREMPNIQAVYDKYHGADFDILSVAVWDKVEDTKQAAEELDIRWNQIINAQQIPTDLYGIDGIPHIILFGPDGTILKRELRGAAIEAEIAKYVKAKN